jgi:hypothetical protein
LQNKETVMAQRIGMLVGVLALAAAASPAQAFGEKWYIEVGVGNTRFKDVTLAGMDGLTRNFFDSFDLTVQSLSSTLDTKDRSYSLLSGYKFGDYFTMEAGYVPLGAFRYKSTGTVDDAGTVLPSAFDFTYRANLFLFGATANLPLGERFDVRARLGMTSSNIRIRYTAVADADRLEEGFSDSTQDLYYGVGAGFKLLDYMRIGVDWQHFSNIGSANTAGSTDIDNVTVSFSYAY